MKKKDILHFSLILTFETSFYHWYIIENPYIIANITCIFKLDSLENEISYAISLFLTFVLFRAIESRWPHLYHELRSMYNSSKVSSLEFRNIRNWNGRWIWYDFRKNFKRIAEEKRCIFSFFLKDFVSISSYNFRRFLFISL